MAFLGKYLIIHDYIKFVVNVILSIVLMVIPVDKCHDGSNYNYRGATRVPIIDNKLYVTLFMVLKI